jgi:uncharacterized protein (TIGR03435 family)
MTPISFLGEWLVRSFFLILAGVLLVWLLRVRNPSLRYTVYKVVLAGSLAIPMVHSVLPKVPMEFTRTPVRSLTPPTALHFEHKSPTSTTDPASAPASNVPAAEAFDGRGLAAGLYLLVTGLLLLRLLAGLVLSLRILRRSRRTGLSAEGTDVRESGEVVSPVTLGILRPAMLLPMDWCKWDSAMLDAVIAHERSHIRRRDPAVQFLSAIHRALLWGNPLSWILHRSIVRTAEEISDDDAIKATQNRVTYAEVLLAFMQRSVGQTVPPGIPMARYDRPENRIRRILNSTSIPDAVTRRGIAAILLMGAPLAYLISAAQPIATAALPEFEIASVKPDNPDVPLMVGAKVYPGARVVLSGLSLKALIAIAFRLSFWQISGGEKWIEEDKYIVEAKPSDAMLPRIKNLRYTNYGIEDEHLRAMLQALLIDRFQLKFHRGTKTGTVYALKQNGQPLALRPAEISAEGAVPSADQSRFGSIGYAGAKWSIFTTSMPQLAKFASDFVMHVPVVDKTDLSGQFDYRQRWPDAEPKYSGDQSDSFRNFLQEMGLKLERAKGDVETFVVDHAAKASPN